MTSIPGIRIRVGNEKPFRATGEYVLYWMTAFRRLEWNFSLQHAVDLALELKKPLVLLEILKADYPYASPRFHSFLLEGMAERSACLDACSVFHYPFVEEEPGEGEGLLQALAEKAAVVVTDDFPSFFLPAWVEAEGENLSARLEIVDSNGILPLRAGNRVFSAAYHFRRFLHKNLSEHLLQPPARDPLAGHEALPPFPGAKDVGKRWRRWVPSRKNGRITVPEIPGFERAIRPVPREGTSFEARRFLQRFVSERLSRYADDGNHPDRQATSELSPYLHFGAISAHEVFEAVAGWEGWSPLRLSQDGKGQRKGWWGMGEGSEAFLDQLITWRELGYNMAWQVPDHTSYESLPDWARETLGTHEGDPRPHVYSYDEFRSAETHDTLWNAAQRQLREEGIIHNYLRMLWGKKILEWSRSPREALEIMIDLNDRLALDGRDPNSYSGIFWCLGRYDRGWPERPIYGKVRSMSSDRTRKKVELTDYLERHGG
jgi:deoxyribodipyrimidine photo-lyase